MMNVSIQHKVYAVLFIVATVGLASSISLVGGVGIEVVGDKLLPIVPLVIVLPALNSLVGDYATLIAAHAGDPAERRRSKKALVRALLPSISINCVLITVIGLLLAAHRGFNISGEFAATFTGFIVGSVLAVIALMLLVTTILDKLLERHELNPDDLLIPIVTTVSDILMLGLVALAAVYVF